MAGPDYPRMGSAKFTEPEEHVPPREHWLSKRHEWHSNPLFAYEELEEIKRKYNRDMAVQHLGVDPNITPYEFDLRTRYPSSSLWTAPYYQHGEGPSTTGEEGTEPWHQPDDLHPVGDRMTAPGDRRRLQRDKARAALRADDARNFNAMWARDFVPERPQEGEERGGRRQEEGLTEEDAFFQQIAESAQMTPALPTSSDQSQPPTLSEPEQPAQSPGRMNLQQDMEARKNLSNEDFQNYISHRNRYPGESVDWQMFGMTPGQPTEGLPGVSNLESGAAAPPDVIPTAGGIAGLAAAALLGPKAIMDYFRKRGGGGGGAPAQAPFGSVATPVREGIAGAEQAALRGALKGQVQPQSIRMTRDAARRLRKAPEVEPIDHLPTPKPHLRLLE